MKSILKFFMIVFAFTSFTAAKAQITIHTIGDSTMATYDPNTSDIRGWGMMFQPFFTSDIIINNRGKNGASSKSFYLEAPYWATVKQQIKPGDYVIIQFAHNDEKNGGLDGGTDPANPINGTDYRGTTPQTTYKFYIRKYIDETRALGAIPILATSICRNYFSGTTITRKGLHDLGPDFSLPDTDDTYDYTVAMKEVAVEKNVKLIDLTTLTKNLVESYGFAASSSQLYVSADSTHPTALYGSLIARLCAQDMVRQNILASYINASTDLLISPTAVDFGDAYTNQILNKELSVSGFDLTPATGTVTFTTTPGFLISLDKTGIYSQSITMNYSGGNLTFTKFYISTTQSTPGQKTGTLTAGSGALTKTVPLKANFIELTGGTEVNVKWDLTADNTYVLTGPAIPVDQKSVGLTVQAYSAPSSTTIWPTESGYTTTRKTQRNDPQGGTWPAGEIDEVSTRYTEFGVTASAGTELNIDKISMYVGGSGGSGMRCRVSYSTDDFATVFVAGELQGMTSNTMYFVSKIPVLKLEAGKTIKVRVYPWYNTSAATTGKRICLSDVNIHGVALPAATLGTAENTGKKITWIVQNGFINIVNADKNSNVTIYDLSGKILYNKKLNGEFAGPKTKGVYIGKTESPDGKVSTSKFIVR